MFKKVTDLLKVVSSKVKDVLVWIKDTFLECGLMGKTFMIFAPTALILFSTVAVYDARDGLNGNKEKIETAFKNAMAGKGYSREPVKKSRRGIDQEWPKAGGGYEYVPARFGRSAREDFKVSRNDSVFSVRVENFKSASGKDSIVVSKPAFEYMKPKI